MATVGSRSHRIAQAIDWLKSNFARPFRVDDLASRVSRSKTTFHRHFRTVTAMSPLQYQKRWRLNEAKRLMLMESLDAAAAALQVGYESASQFSREYARMFGAPPSRDIMNSQRSPIVKKSRVVIPPYAGHLTGGVSPGFKGRKRDQFTILISFSQWFGMSGGVAVSVPMKVLSEPTRK